MWFSSRTTSKWPKPLKNINLQVKCVLRRPSSNGSQPKQKESMPPNYDDLVEEYVQLKCSMPSVVETNTTSKRRSRGWSIPCSPVHLQSLSKHRFNPMEHRVSICSMNCIVWSTVKTLRQAFERNCSLSNQVVKP